MINSTHESYKYRFRLVLVIKFKEDIFIIFKRAKGSKIIEFEELNNQTIFVEHCFAIRI